MVMPGTRHENDGREVLSLFMKKFFLMFEDK
jgi:hypothetical protein